MVDIRANIDLKNNNLNNANNVGAGGGGGSSYAGSGTSSVTHTQGHRSGNGYCTISW